MKISPWWLILTCIVMLIGMTLIAFAHNADEKLCEAIFKAEGVNSKYPYGIRSVNCDNKQECRRICLTTVARTRQRYKEYVRNRNNESAVLKTFIEFLASRYCPASTDSKGHENWKRNVKYFLKKGAK